MKKLSTLFFGMFIMIACTQEHPKEYLTLSGKLENNQDSIISISSTKGIVKTIRIDKDGSFKDTLKVEKASIYTFQTSADRRAPIYLKNGYNIILTGDADKFMQSFKFSGIGASNSNFIVAQIEKSQKMGNPQDILDLEEKAFKKKVAALKFEYDSILDSYKDLDSTLYTSVKGQNEQLVAYFDNAYAQNKVMGAGKMSPKFENYTDIKGGTKSLDFYKGKYVYIDVWATWCGPCIQQIPYLQTLEKEYQNKNIEFISISTDEAQRSGGSWDAAEKKWRAFVKKRNMSGVQLWAGKDYSFQQAYQITGIPRFILVDPQGKIVEANAPRPSDPNLKALFTSLGL
ncbi:MULTISPECIES: TlpA family protein disulfide reductase [unclassified Polaribacter]|uniref:TlpA family protein disulfide reductase n=1 Tax=unclassified Polaribacter TaxID=196858 RepID=UPI0011BF2DE4|nr:MULTISPECIES: TlpA disulfide reductase family protein [unclassified Polaribacter]TXD50855.1 TlpA family protein disulfide reductase [Polaribacter sp. IC063]TXD57680.1 TlpA family protein disulfide reductase [Polaribacter sp. IC066]